MNNVIEFPVNVNEVKFSKNLKETLRKSGISEEFSEMAAKKYIDTANTVLAKNLKPHEIRVPSELNTESGQKFVSEIQSIISANNEEHKKIISQLIIKLVLAELPLETK